MSIYGKAFNGLLRKVLKGLLRKSSILSFREPDEKTFEELLRKALKGLLRKSSILRFKNYQELKKIVNTLSNDEIEWLKELSKNNPYAQNNLGYMYKNSIGVEKDYKEAVRLYRLSADQGYSYAQNNLGYMYNLGFGVEKDLKEAVRL